MKNEPEKKPKVCCGCGITCWVTVEDLPYCKKCEKIAYAGLSVEKWISQNAPDLEDLEHKFV